MNRHNGEMDGTQHSTPGPKYCSRCGAANRHDAKYCKDCGGIL